jgi:hypothetical protein
MLRGPQVFIVRMFCEWLTSRPPHTVGVPRLERRPSVSPKPPKSDRADDRWPDEEDYRIDDERQIFH